MDTIKSLIALIAAVYILLIIGQACRIAAVAVGGAIDAGDERAILAFLLAALYLSAYTQDQIDRSPVYPEDK